MDSKFKSTIHVPSELYQDTIRFPSFETVNCPSIQLIALIQEIEHSYSYIFAFEVAFNFRHLHEIQKTWQRISFKFISKAYAIDAFIRVTRYFHPTFTNISIT